VEGFELPCESLDGIDKLGHSELDRFEICNVRRGSTESWGERWQLCLAGLGGLGGHGQGGVLGIVVVRDRVTLLEPT